jgi:uncharacterized protein (TIGR02611 family)
VAAQRDEPEREQQEERDRPEVPDFVRKLREQRERHLGRSRIVRVLFIVAGFTIFLGGVVMLVTPGPAFVLIPIGLAILSLEFVWAERLLDRSLEEAAKAKKRAAETTTTQRVLSGIATALAIGAIVAWAIWGDIPLVPV